MEKRIVLVYLKMGSFRVIFGVKMVDDAAAYYLHLYQTPRRGPDNLIVWWQKMLGNFSTMVSCFSSYMSFIWTLCFTVEDYILVMNDSNKRWASTSLDFLLILKEMTFKYYSSGLPLGFVSSTSHFFQIFYDCWNQKICL